METDIHEAADGGSGGGEDSAAPEPGLIDQPRESLPKTEGSSRLLWAGAALALVVHLLPFLWFGEAEPLGEGVLTEAIAVELVDKASIEGLDQTPHARPEAAAPPPTPSSQQSPPRPPQKAQPAVSPSPPPRPKAESERPVPEKEPTKPPQPAPPAFAGDQGLAPKATEKQEEAKKEAAETDADRPKAQPSPPRPKPRPPQEATPPPSPPPQPTAKPAPPRAASAPAQAKSGQVTKFAKEVVAALAKAKPNAPGIKGKVTVTVVVAFGGGVRVAKVTGSSGRDDLDKLALEAAKKAPLPAPPPDVATDDLFYDVEYDFK